MSRNNTTTTEVLEYETDLTVDYGTPTGNRTKSSKRGRREGFKAKQQQARAWQDTNFRSDRDTDKF